jgi:hypothetical protein
MNAFVTGDFDPPEPTWPEGGRTVVTGDAPLLLKLLPEMAQAFIDESGRKDELVTVEWRVSMTGEFEIRVRPVRKRPL